MSPDAASKVKAAFELVIIILTIVAVIVFSKEDSDEPGLQQLSYMHLKKSISSEKMVLCDDNFEGLDSFVLAESEGIIDKTSINKREGDKIPDFIIANRANADEFDLVIEVESKDGIRKEHTREQMKYFCQKYDDVCLVTINKAEALSRAIELRKDLDYNFKIETPTTLSTQL